MLWCVTYVYATYFPFLCPYTNKHTKQKDEEVGVSLQKLYWRVCVSLPDSELQIALVALFSEMLYRFPNVVVAQVTRESVQQAIANGITAQQVLNYCTHNVLLWVEGAL